jgi:hypothetical protein
MGCILIPGQRSPMSPDIGAQQHQGPKSGDFGVRIALFGRLAPNLGCTPDRSFWENRPQFKLHSLACIILTNKILFIRIMSIIYPRIKP